MMSGVNVFIDGEKRKSKLEGRVSYPENEKNLVVRSSGATMPPVC